MGIFSPGDDPVSRLKQKAVDLNRARQQDTSRQTTLRGVVLSRPGNKRSYAYTVDKNISINDCRILEMAKRRKLNDRYKVLDRGKD